MIKGSDEESVSEVLRNNVHGRADDAAHHTLSDEDIISSFSKHTISPNLSDGQYIDAVFTHKSIGKVAKYVEDEQFKALNQCRADNQKKQSIYNVRGFNNDVAAPREVYEHLEALFGDFVPSQALSNDKSTRSLQYRTYKMLGGKDMLPTVCSNVYSELPVSKGKTRPAHMSGVSFLNGPTICRHRRKESTYNILRHMRLKDKKYVLSKWQERLLASQRDRYTSLTIDISAPRSKHYKHQQKRLSDTDEIEDKWTLEMTSVPRHQKIKIRNMLRSAVMEGRLGNPFNSSSDAEAMETSEQRYNAVSKIAHKLPANVLENIYHYLEGVHGHDHDFIEEIILEKLNKNRMRNCKRQIRRRKALSLNRIKKLHQFCIRHRCKMFHREYVRNIISENVTIKLSHMGKYNNTTSYLYRYCPENTVLYEIPEFYLTKMTKEFNEYNGILTTQSREQYSIPVRIFLEGLDFLKDPENYNYTQVIGICEDLITTMILMNHSKNWQIALLNFKQWLRMTFGLSVCGTIYNWVENLFAEDLHVQAGGFDRVKQIFSDWKSIYQGEFMSKVKKAIACVIALGFCTINNLPFCTEKFSDEYKKGKYGSRSYPDLVTCILETVILIFEKAHNWFTGNCAFLDIFRSPCSSYDYDTEMSFLRANISLYEEDKLLQIGIERYQFEERAQEAIRLTKTFYDQSTGSERRVMQINLNDLARIRTKMLLATQAMTIRQAPFCYYLYGKSSIGKTSVSDILNNALLRANGFDPDPKFQVSLNPSDAYQSEMESWKILVKLDDLANAAPEYEDGNPINIVLDYANNNPRHALKADVDSKGKVLIQPKIFMATTNVKYVDAHVKSNEPLSIIRRLNKCITMVVRPEFRRPGSHMLDPSKMVNDINDAWLFTVEEPKILPSTQEFGATPFEFQVCTYNGVEMKGVGMGLLLEYLIFESKKHFVEQRSLIESVGIVQRTELCPHDTYRVFCQHCLAEPLEVQSKLTDDITEIAYAQLRKVHKMWYMIMEFIPYHILEGEGMWYYLRTIMGSTLVWLILSYYHVIFILLLILYAMFGSFFTMFCFQTFFTYVVSTVLLKCIANIDKIHQNCKKVAQKAIKTMEPVIKHKYYVLAGMGTVGVVLMLARKFRTIAPTVTAVLNTQGSEYKTPAPDAVQRENPWVKPHVELPPRTLEVATATIEQLAPYLSRCLAHAIFRSEATTQKMNCCIMPVKGNTWLIPYHVVRGYTFNTVEIIRREGDINSNRVCSIHTGSWIRIGDSDMALISLPSAGDVADITPYLLSEPTLVCEPVRWIHKNERAEITTEDFVAVKDHIYFKDQKDGHEYNYDGWHYEMMQTTFTGMCMAPIISKGKFPWILGFHSAGSDGTRHGVAHIVTKHQVDMHYELLFDRKIGDFHKINVQCHSSGTMKLDFPEYGIKHIGELHSKSPFNFMEKGGCAILYGKHTGNRRTFRSAVEKSYVADSVCRVFNVEMMFGKPKNIGNYIPWHMEASKMMQPYDMDMDVLANAYADLERHIFEFLDKHSEYKDILSPMSRVATLSGVDGCRGIDAVKLSTSAGFPRCKPKSNYIFESDEDFENITRPLDVEPETWAEVERLEDILAKGERVYFIHRINLKDEPTKLGKEKVRTFAGCTLECLIMVRMYFLPIAKMMMDHPDVFECAIGVNAHGPEWTELTERMMKHGEDRTIAGDYADYDTKMWCFIVLLAFYLLISIAKWAGYSERQLCIMRGIATELAYGLTEFNGEFAMWLIANWSGHGLTVFLNNIGNCIFMRYTYYDIWSALALQDEKWLSGFMEYMGFDEAEMEEFSKVFFKREELPKEYPEPFAKMVSLVCYGDDNKMSVSRDINYFNHCTISYSLRRVGVQYTMADKTSKSVPFIHASECNFLKRSGVWSEEFKQYLAPLEIKSLFKTLQSSLVSKVMTRKQQSVEAIDNVLRELFYHGEDVFNEWRSKLDIVIDECDLRSHFKGHQLHTYDWLKSQYVTKYLCDSDIKNNHASNSIDEIAKKEVIVLNTQSGVSTGHHSSDKALLFQGEDSYLGMSSPAQGNRPHDDDNHSHYVVNQRVATTTTTTPNKVNAISSMMGPERHQNVVFRDGTPQWESSIVGGYDETRKVGMDLSVPIESFFSRPIKVDMPDWIPGSPTPYSFTLDPWTTFFENKRVSNRISNFNLLQATLKVKIIINGNAFYYGRLMADYAPLASLRTLDNFNTTNGANLVSASQRSHLYLNPTTSQGGEMHLPFIFPKNALSIPSAEWQLMGNVYFREVNQLKHANGATTPVSVIAYVWAEDVLLSVPTTLNAGGLTPQSRDEYGSKPISNMASNIAKLTGSMDRIPVIGPYAKATSMMMSGLGAAAKTLGFSRPAQLEDSSKMIPKPVSRMAVTDVGDAVAKLTVDSKQELTIDPKVVGVDTGDELAIKTIATKESLLNRFPWTVASATDTLLYNIRVTPCTAVINSTYVVDTAYQLTACGFASVPFKYWRGTMKYRFQIVCSDYHRGRLRIVYDPQYMAVGSTTESNLGFTKIVDLTDDRDFTVEVAWGQTQTYLQTSSAVANYQSGTNVAITNAAPSSNGVLSVFVLNELTTPNSTVNNDIFINVSVSACDDIEYQVPNTLLRGVSYTPQSNMSVEDASDDSLDNAPIQETSEEQIMDCLSLDHTNDVYFGESITTFRQLLKRYAKYRSTLSPLTGRSLWKLRKPDYPFYRGVNSVGLGDVVLPGTTAANIVDTTLLTYLAPAYLAMRGGFRWKYAFYNDNVVSPSYIVVSREEDVGTTYQSVVTNYSVANASVFASTQSSVNSWPTGLEGQDVTVIGLQPVVEVEVPNYNNNRFTLPKRNSLGDTTFGPWLNFHKLFTQINSSTFAFYNEYVATAEDFNLHLFQGAPPMCFPTLTPV